MKALVVSWLALVAAQTRAQPLHEQRNPVVYRSERGLSAPLSLLPAQPVAEPPEDTEVLPVPRQSVIAPGPDTVVQRNAPVLAMPSLATSFEGVGQGFTGPAGAFTVNSAPPDTNGDVGPNHYVQTVNADFAVFDKTGKALAGPLPINSLFSGFSGGAGLCASTNQGDPIVLYDPLADRWLISQFAFSGTKGKAAAYYQCVAISQTPDPTGAYYQYAFGPYTIGGKAALNDYPKFGVWPDGYYFTANMFTSSFQGAMFCAFDRASMLTGAAATQQCFQQANTIGGVLPTDFDGHLLPPAGSPDYFLTFDNTTASILQFWRFHVDWTTPANSTVTGPLTLPVAAITTPCNNTAGSCVPQPGTTQQLDTLGDRMMYRLAYRNFGDHESLVANHTVQVTGGQTGVRWYELQNPDGGTLASGTPVLYQQGTFAPDTNWRWMASLAQDQLGDLAVGYSTSSSSVFPTIDYAGRLPSDPLGTLSQGESTLFAGAGAQQTNLNRWGDYSMMGIDPTDDCTFWYTQEYLAANGTFNWSTSVGSFKFPSCTGYSYQLNGLPPSVSAGTSLPFSVSAVDQGGNAAATYNGTAKLATSDAKGVLPATATFQNGTTSGLTVTLKTPGSQTITATDVSNSALTATVTITVQSGPLAAYQVGLPASANAGTAVPVTLTAVDLGGNTVTSYSGTANLASSDGKATFSPSTASFTAGVASGVQVTFQTAGTQSVTATDSANPAITGSASTPVNPGALAKYLVALPATVPAGADAGFSVTATDSAGNTVSSYAGTANLLASDSAATLPATAAFTAGVASGLPVTFKTAGPQTVTATDTTTSSVTGTGNTQVLSGPAASYAISGLAPAVQAHQATSFTVTALDGFGNVATDYAGTAKITSSDSAATLPANPTFASGKASGVSITLATLGAQTVTATDTQVASLTATASTTVQTYVDAGTPDGGSDGGTARNDGGSGAPDGGQTKVKSGCGCGASDSGFAFDAVALLGALAVMLLKRRAI